MTPMMTRLMETPEGLMVVDYQQTEADRISVLEEAMASMIEEKRQADIFLRRCDLLVGMGAAIVITIIAIIT